MLCLLLLHASALVWVVAGYNLDTVYPLVYHVQQDSKRAGYFGMSVAIRPKASSLNNTWSIQVGAPRGSIPGSNITEPGVIYRCHVYGPCQMSLAGRKVNKVGGKGVYAYKERKDRAWIGVSMDIKDFATYERSVVCGHRWINQNLKNPEKIDVTYLMTGICYLQDLNETTEAPVRKLLPLVNSDKIYTPKPYRVDLSTYHWGLGQSGISVKLIEEPSILLIGAPGVTHWIGSVVRYDPDLKVFVGNFAKSEIARKNRYTYLGYSVAAGRFYQDRKLWFVAGAPRSANYHGEVFIFQYKGSTDSIYIQSNLVGSTFGEYFGSSLTTSDVNADGFDDLIVGAPLYSDKDPDEGRIYVFLGTNRGNFLLQSQVIAGQVSNGRFGSCVASLQDLDQDGYDDVAVGAPYENDQRGAVYVYRGTSQGLQTEYSQRISAQDVYPSLRGFGISISSPVDVDDNRYRDIAIGSYLSDDVVLLRSHPVVSLHPQVRVDGISAIDRKSSFFNVSLCLRYTGSNVPSYADIVRIVEVDPLYGRGTFHSPKTSHFTKIVRLPSNGIFCEVLPVFLDLSKKNYSPMQINMKVELPSCSKSKGGPLLISSQNLKESDRFSKWCPVGNKADTSKEIAFAGICGTDLTCHSDLKLSCEVPDFRSGTYILGSSENILLSLNLQNLGEPAYNTKIKIWSNVRLTHNDKHDSSSVASRKTFWIDVDGALSESFQSNFSFKINLDRLTELKPNNGSETDLILIIEVYTSSIDVDLKNNKCRFSVKLISDSVVNLYSSSSLVSFFVRKKMAEEQLNVTHYYEVQKTGATPVTDAFLTVYIPSCLGKEFLNFTVETPSWMHLSTEYEKLSCSHNSTKSVSKKTHSVDVTSKENHPPENRTLFLNCSKSEQNCQILKIFFTDGIPTGISSYVKILISFSIGVIDSIKGEKDIVHFTTSGILRYSKVLEGKSQQLYGTASVSLYNEERIGKRVDGYVIALSILAGGVLLSLIVTGLVKSYFFKRTKKQELKALKEAEENFIYFAMEEEGETAAGGCSKVEE